MSQRRMFSKTITNSSAFLMMSPSAQSLYFHIGMNADDDGFCEIFTVMRMTESKPDDLRSLHEKNFIYVIDSRVCIVKDWHVHNYVQKDRYAQSAHLKNTEIAQIYQTVIAPKYLDNERYKNLSPECVQTVLEMDSQVRLELGKSKDSNIRSNTLAQFELFWKMYPKKINKKRAEMEWKKAKLSDETIKEIMDHLEKRIRTNWIKEKNKYVIYPERFIKYEKWNDDLSEFDVLEELAEDGFLDLSKK